MERDQQIAVTDTSDKRRNDSTQIARVNVDRPLARYAKEPLYREGDWLFGEIRARSSS